MTLTFWVFVATVALSTYVQSASIKGDHANDWCYDAHDGRGPTKWAKLEDDNGTILYPECAGQKQSPIDFKMTENPETHLADIKGPVVFNSYDEELKEVKITNNGHTVQISTATTKPTISNVCQIDSSTSDTYQFLQMHFHWGAKDDKGSEHTLEGKAFPMEIHLVHFNQKYGNVGEALKFRDGLAVIGIFFNITKEINPKYDPIIKALSKINKSGKETNITDKITLQQLLPEKPGYFFCYEGSLTTPSCKENVAWIVYADPLPISANQMQFFRGIFSSKWGEARKFMNNNFRLVQPLNKRKTHCYSPSR